MQKSTVQKTGELVEWLNQMMETGYGGLHTARVNTAEKNELWTRMWSNSLRGKNASAVKWALEACFTMYPQPFTVADFCRQYDQAPRTKPQYALPRPKADPAAVERHVRSLKASLLAINDPSRVTRTEASRSSGAWTEEMEAAFQSRLSRLQA